MSQFVFFNWFCCLLTGLLLFWVIWKKKHLLIKPSLIVIIFFHLRIQWAATVGSSYIEGYLPDPWVFAILSQLFPLLGLLGSLLTWQYSAHAIWQRLSNPDLDDITDHA